jgi:hypothetical protein
MRKEIWLAAVTLGVVVTGAWWLKPPQPAAQVAQGNKPVSAADALPARAVLRISPNRAAPSPLAQPVLAAAVSADLQQLRDKRDWPGLFQRLKNGPQTPEALWLQGEIMRACAKPNPAAGPGPGPAPATTPDERRKRFLAGVAENDPQRAARIAAFEKLSVDACGELANAGFTREDAQKMIAAAATAAHPRARAEMLADDIFRASREAQEKERGDGPRGGMGRLVVSDEQLKTVQELLQSRDPGALAELRNILASTWRDSVVQLGPDREPIDARAMMAALQLLGCDVGTPCDAGSSSVLSRCAYQAQCAASTLPDQVFYYDASPHQAQLVERYRQSLLEMMRTGDFSNLRVARGVPNAGNVFIFGSQRGP